MDIFVSYARAHESRAREVSDALRALGYSVWRDDLLPAHRLYSDIIEEHLRAAKAVLVLWSQDAVRSEWVRSEADRARQLGKLVQLAIEPVTLPMPFDQIHCAEGASGDFQTSSPGWLKVLASLDELVAAGGGRTGGETPSEEGSSARVWTEAPRERLNNLPAAIGDLIGRADDVERTAAALARSRLVSILGPGGVGKTRLALDVVRRRMPEHEDGAWLVELAGVGDPQRVGELVAKAIGVELPAGVSGRKPLIDYLQRRDCLLLLDNCEHLILAVAELAEEILSRAPRVRLLLTSRESLGIEGEQIVLLDPLGEDDAIALFFARVRAIDPAFVPGAADHRAALDICRHLDGVPLAIEMAAARAPMLGCAEVLRRISDRFRVLTGGRRTALPRQQTLHATLDWSHNLLSERDATVFRRLGVFVGDFSLEAACAVAGDDGLDGFEVMDSVASLVSKSLVSIKRGVLPRYVLLETTREYALEKLNTTGELAARRRRHAQFYADLARSIWTDFNSEISDDALLSRYLPEFANIDRAIDWTVEPEGDAEIGLRLLADSSSLWDDRSLKRRLDVAVSMIGETTPPDVRARLLASRAHVVMMAESPSAALEVVDEAIAAVRAHVHDDIALCDVLASKAAALWYIRRAAAARPIVDEMIALMADKPPSRIKALAMGIEAAVVLVERGPAAAAAIYDAAIASLTSFGAEGLAHYWLYMKLRLIPSADVDVDIDNWRRLFTGVHAGQMYADARRREAARGLAERLAKRGEPADLTEALALAAVYFKTGAETVEPRFLLPMAIVAVKSGRAEDAATILGYVDIEREIAHERAASQALADATRALISEAMDDATRGRWGAQGAAMNGDEIIAVALGHKTARLVEAR
jgi:predicted ATPase